MHSSQDEQDSRYYAEFAMIPCLEPTNQQEAYEMTREAFDLSERFQVPVMIRITTRLAHSRAGVSTRAPRDPNPLGKSTDNAAWTLLPANARKRYDRLCRIQTELEAWSTASPWNAAAPGSAAKAPFAVVTGGLGRNTTKRTSPTSKPPSAAKSLPSRLHVGAYPLPAAKLRELAAANKRILVIEEGAPLIEKALRGILSPAPKSRASSTASCRARASSTRQCPRRAGPARLGRSPRSRRRRCPSGRPSSAPAVPMRTASPPRQGCRRPSAVGHLRRHRLLALGAPTALQRPRGARLHRRLDRHGRRRRRGRLRERNRLIGDSTFLHSGVTPLIDAVSRKAPVTIVILDNSIVAMPKGSRRSCRRSGSRNGQSRGRRERPRRGHRRLEVRRRRQRRGLPTRARVSRALGHHRQAQASGDQGEEEKGATAALAAAAADLRGGGSRMTCDIVLAGVGGQGVLSIAAIIAGAAMADGLKVRQSEVHGMAQRGGAVSAHLRISDCR